MAAKAPTPTPGSAAAGFGPGAQSKARAAPKVERPATNAQIIEALRIMGYIPKDAEVDAGGPQSSVFLNRMGAQFGVTPADFTKARELAATLVEDGWPTKTIEEWKRTATPDEVPLQGFLRVAGKEGFLSPERINRITNLAVYGEGVGKPAGVAGIGVGPRVQETPMGTTRQGAPIAPKKPPPAAGAPGAPAPPPGPPTAAQIAAELAALLPKDKPPSPDEIRAIIQTTYGWGAGLIDVPDVARILDDAASGRISPAEANQHFLGSDFYKTTTMAERTWKSLKSTDPADAARQFDRQFNTILRVAREAGIPNPDHGRMQHLTELALSYGWDDTEVARYLSFEVKYDPTGETTGVFDDLKDRAYRWVVPLSDQAMTAWGQAIVGGTKTTDDFDDYMRDMSSSLYPAFANNLKDPNFDTRKLLDPYAEHIAEVLGSNPADIDWKDPKWRRFIDQVDPKTNQRTVMSMADVSRTVMSDAAYGYDESTNGKIHKRNFTLDLMRQFGFK